MQTSIAFILCLKAYLVTTKGFNTLVVAVVGTTRSTDLGEFSTGRGESDHSRIDITCFANGWVDDATAYRQKHFLSAHQAASGPYQDYESSCPETGRRTGLYIRQAGERGRG